MTTKRSFSRLTFPVGVVHSLSAGAPDAEEGSAGARGRIHLPGEVAERSGRGQRRRQRNQSQRILFDSAEVVESEYIAINSVNSLSDVKPGLGDCGGGC